MIYILLYVNVSYIICHYHIIIISHYYYIINSIYYIIVQNIQKGTFYIYLIKSTLQITIICDNIYVTKNNIMQKLYTKHYKSQILNTKKIKLNNKIYIGFNINDLQNIKLKDKLTLNNVIEFNLKGLTFINKNNIQKSTLQFI